MKIFIYVTLLIILKSYQVNAQAPEILLNNRQTLKITSTSAFANSAKISTYCGSVGKIKTCRSVISDKESNELIMPDCSSNILSNIKSCKIISTKGMKKMVNTKKNITNYLEIGNDYAILTMIIKSYIVYMIFEFESNSSIQKPAIEAAFKQIVEVNNPDYNRCLSYCIIDQQECYLDNSINKPDADLSTCDFSLEIAKEIVP